MIGFLTRVPVSTVFWVLLSTIVCLALSPTPLVLDEETYLWIANEITWMRPYDWQMPFPPFSETGFVFAHPPLFIWWVKLMGNGFGVAIPWLLLWWSSVCVLLRRCSISRFEGICLLLGSTSALLPMTRTLMPDLMMGSLALAGLVLFNGRIQKRDVWLAGLCLGLASWTKYPALLLVLVPFITERSVKDCWILLATVFCLVGVGELWLWTVYDQWHLLEVIKQVGIVGRSPLESRIFGTPARVSVSVLPFLLVSIWIRPKITLTMTLIGTLLGGVFGLLVSLGVSFLFITMTHSKKYFWQTSIALVLLGIVVGHNYIAPRYWFVIVPMMIPIFSESWKLRTVAFRRVVITVALLWSGLLWHTERQHAQSIEYLASQMVTKERLTHFSGEWGFRQVAQKQGLRQFTGKENRFVTIHNAAGWVPHPDDGWVLDQRMEGPKVYFRLVSQKDSVGYYADSLGRMPFGFSMQPQPIETVEIWNKR